MSGTPFNKVQWGKESTFLTAVAADKRWPGIVTVPPDRKPVQVPETLSLRARSARSEVYQVFADGIVLAAEHGFFEALPMLLAIMSKGDVTLTEQTVSEGDYLGNFSPSLTGSNSLDSITLEYGDDTQAYEIEGVTGRRLQLSGKFGDDSPIGITADLFGRQITPTTFTPAVAVGSRTGMVANMARLYYDDTWANLGTTQMTEFITGFDLEILFGNHPNFHGDSKSPTHRGEGYIDVMLRLPLKGNTDADAAFDHFQAQTARAIRLDLQGPQIGAGDNNSCVVDIFGHWEEMQPLAQSENDENRHEALFVGHTDLADLVDINVTTPISAI